MVQRAIAENRRRLYGIAYAILRDHGEAEDALQDAMWSAWKHRASLRDDDLHRAWLTQVCVRQCISRQRRLRRLIVSEPERFRAAPEDPRFEGRQLDIANAYGQLSTRQRSAVVLHYEHGYTVDECAALMGCGAGSVRTHITRALVSLRKEISHE